MPIFATNNTSLDQIADEEVGGDDNALAKELGDDALSLLARGGPLPSKTNNPVMTTKRFGKTFSKRIGKGLGKRYQRVLRDNVQGISKPAIRRLARRGGVKRMSGLIYEETRGVLKTFLTNLLRDTIVYTQHAQRKTVMTMDVVHALARQGRTIYGFDK